MNLLLSFIQELEDRGLLEFDILNDDEHSFTNRFMIQKYVYLARYFGLDMDYHLGMYLQGHTPKVFQMTIMSLQS
jgi:uncharacterized protein YwgA